MVGRCNPQLSVLFVFKSAVQQVAASVQDVLIASCILVGLQPLTAFLLHTRGPGLRAIKASLTCSQQGSAKIQCAVVQAQANFKLDLPPSGGVRYGPACLCWLYCPFPIDAEISSYRLGFLVSMCSSC